MGGPPSHWADRPTAGRPLTGRFRRADPAGVPIANCTAVGTPARIVRRFVESGDEKLPRMVPLFDAVVVSPASSERHGPWP